MHHEKHYPKDSAGRLMTEAVPTVRPRATVGDVRRLLERDASAFVTLNYVYVTDESKRLLGVLSLREILQAPVETVVSSIATTTLVTARPHTDRERVAHLAIAHNLKAVPIVHGPEHLFLGVVASDAILETLNQEHTEDVMRFAGVAKHHDFEEHLLSGNSLAHVRSRLPWLVLGLGGGVAAAAVVHLFEGTLADQLILAAFIPAIVYMADAVGSQTQMLFIRALTINAQLSIRWYLAREFLVNVLLASILASLIFVCAQLWHGTFAVSLILGLSIFLTVCMTVLIAVLLPWCFYKQGYDPAIASGPLATVLRDIMSLSIYLLIAALVI